MSRIDLSRYTVEFRRNFGFGYKMYTWFVSRANYSKNGWKTSDSVWVYTTDSSTFYDDWNQGVYSPSEFIRLIKSIPMTDFYNERR